MRKLKTKNIMGALGVAFAGTLLATPANATEGYFQHGAGARNKAMAGAGVADSKDAVSLAINPAGIVDSDHALVGSLALFIPDRQFTGSGGPGFTPTGTVSGNESSSFVIPTIAYSRAVGENGAIAFSLTANGGMNTDYTNVANPACAMPGLPNTTGIFCGGKAGVNLSQAFIAVGYAHRFESFSVGISPIFVFQMFEGRGLGAFGAATVDPVNLSDNSASVSTGVGIKFGAQWDVTDFLRIGGAYTPKIGMSEFDEYAGLFADGGDFDVPENFVVGLAWDAMPNLTVALDYRSIKYSKIGAIGNSGQVPLPFGSPGGPGFGWKDVDAFKVGVEYEASDELSLRAGYAHNNNPISGNDVTLNILAPGVITDHFTAGFEQKFGRHSLQGAIMYAPSEKVSGIEFAFFPNPGHTIELDMKQLDFTVGWKYRFGQ